RATIARFEDAGHQRTALLAKPPLAVACCLLGAHAEAASVARDAITEAEGAGLGWSLRAAQCFLGDALALQGEAGEASPGVRTAIEASVANADGLWEGMARMYLAAALKRSGDSEGAEAEARSAISLLAAFPLEMIFAMATLGDVLLGRGRAAEAEEHARR